MVFLQIKTTQKSFEANIWNNSNTMFDKSKTLSIVLHSEQISFWLINWLVCRLRRFYVKPILKDLSK